MTRARRAALGLAVGLLIVVLLGACSVGDDAADPSPTTDAPGASTAVAAPTSLDDVLLTAEDVPEPLGRGAPSDDSTWILRPLCDGRPEVVIPAPEEIVGAGFEGPDDDVWLSSTAARFEGDGAQATIEAYRSEVDRCALEEDVHRDAVGDDGLVVRVEHGEGEGVRRWVARVGDVVVEVSLHWLFPDPAVLDRMLEEGPALLDAVIARAGGTP